MIRGKEKIWEIKRIMYKTLICKTVWKNYRMKKP